MNCKRKILFLRIGTKALIQVKAQPHLMNNNINMLHK